MIPQKFLAKSNCKVLLQKVRKSILDGFWTLGKVDRLARRAPIWGIFGAEMSLQVAGVIVSVLFRVLVIINDSLKVFSQKDLLGFAPEVAKVVKTLKFRPKSLKLSPIDIAIIDLTAPSWGEMGSIGTTQTAGVLVFVFSRVFMIINDSLKVFSQIELLGFAPEGQKVDFGVKIQQILVVAV